jgi:hypothetical protein
VEGALSQFPHVYGDVEAAEIEFRLFLINCSKLGFLSPWD